MSSVIKMQITFREKHYSKRAITHSACKILIGSIGPTH